MSEENKPAVPEVEALRGPQGRNTAQPEEAAGSEESQYFDFLKRYFAYFAVVGAIPLLTGAIGFLEPPSQVKQLSILASLFSVIVFFAIFHMRPMLAAFVRNKFGLFIACALALATLYGCALATAHYTEIISNDTDRAMERALDNIDKHPLISPDDLRHEVLIYLLIHSSFSFALGIVAVLSFNSQKANRVHRLVSDELRDDAERIEQNLENFAQFRRMKKPDQFQKLGTKLILNMIAADLSKLAIGEIETTSSQASDELYGALLDSFGKSFNAVSDRHLHFWDRSNPDRSTALYLNRNFEAAKNGTCVNRIFLFNDAQTSKWDTIESVLEEHDRRHLGWAVIPFESLDPSIQRRRKEELDFALFDLDQAISYFRSYDDEFTNYHVIFSVDRPDNRKLLTNQFTRYVSMLLQAWYVNAQFVENMKSIVEKAPDAVRKSWEEGSAPRGDHLVLEFLSPEEKLQYAVAKAALNEADTLPPELLCDRKKLIEASRDSLEKRSQAKRDRQTAPAGSVDWDNCFLLGVARSPAEIREKAQLSLILRRAASNWSAREATPSLLFVQAWPASDKSHVLVVSALCCDANSAGPQWNYEIHNGSGPPSRVNQHAMREIKALPGFAIHEHNLTTDILPAGRYSIVVKWEAGTKAAGAQAPFEVKA